MDNPEVYGSLSMNRHKMRMLAGLHQMIDKSMSSKSDELSIC